MDREQKNDQVRDGVESSADIQHHDEIHTLSRSRTVPDLAARGAFENLEEGVASVKRPVDDHERDEDDIERASTHGREDTAVEHEQGTLGDSNDGAVFDRGHVEPVRSLVGLRRGDVPSMFAAVVGHGGPHDGAIPDSAGPRDGHEVVFQDPYPLDEDTHVGAPEEEDGDQRETDRDGDVGEEGE